MCEASGGVALAQARAVERAFRPSSGRALLFTTGAGNPTIAAVLLLAKAATHLPQFRTPGQRGRYHKKSKVGRATAATSLRAPIGT